MTSRSETVVPLSPESRHRLAYYRSQLLELGAGIDVIRLDLRHDDIATACLGSDVDALIREATDLLTIAARRLNPDQETSR